MSTQLDIFAQAPAERPVAPAANYYECPCCGGRVFDEYVAGDALCCWCRDLSDPRLSERVRTMRESRPGPRLCCLARSRGRSRHIDG